MEIKNKCVFILVFLCMFSFCGCTANRELDEQSLVCTLCFSYKSEYVVTVEVLTENAEEKKLVSKTHTSKGETPEKAIENLNNQMPKRAMFDHCAAIVLSPEMSESKQKQALEYCVKSPTINLGTPVIYCKDQTELLSVKSETAAVGYDIILTLKLKSLEKESRLYKTALDTKNIKTFKTHDGTLMLIDR